MPKVWIVARHEYLTNLRRPAFIAMTVIIPLIGIVGLLIAAIFGGEAAGFLERQLSPEARGMGVVDHSGLFTPLLPEYEGPYRLYPDERSAFDALRADEVGTVLIIPSEYLAQGRVRVISKGSGFSAAALEDSPRAQAFFVDHLLRERVDPATRQRAAHPVSAEAVTLTDAGEAPAGEGPLSIVGTFVVPFFLSIFLVMTIFASAGFLLQGLAEEKETRVIEIVLSSVTARELLAGKVIGLGALGLTQILIWLAAGWFLSGSAQALLAMTIPFLAQPGLLLLAVTYYLLGYTLYAVLMAATGSLGSTQREAQQLAGVFTFLAFIPLMISSILFANPNALLARALSWVPLTAPTMMMLRIALTEVPWVDVLISLLGLLASIPVALWAGAKVFRMGLLMYGKRPGLGQIWRALREA